MPAGRSLSKHGNSCSYNPAGAGSASPPLSAPAENLFPDYDAMAAAMCCRAQKRAEQWPGAGGCPGALLGYRAQCEAGWCSRAGTDRHSFRLPATGAGHPRIIGCGVYLPECFAMAALMAFCRQLPRHVDPTGAWPFARRNVEINGLAIWHKRSLCDATRLNKLLRSYDQRNY